MESEPIIRLMSFKLNATHSLLGLMFIKISILLGSVLGHMKYLCFLKL